MSSEVSKISETEFKSFTCIVDFVQQLKEVLCVDKKHHEITLYNHLLHKVKITNKQNIRRHISLFSDFCARNQNAILNKDSTLITFSTIKYSEKIYIDLGSILKTIDEENKEAIWKHLLVIQATIDPSSKARSVLTNLASSQVPEEQVIGNLMGEISKHVSENDERNPMAIFNSLLQSGVVNQMMTSLDTSVKKGDVDLNKLGNSMQSMLSGLMGGLNNTNSSNSSGSASGGLDLGGMMSSMMTMMSTLSTNTSEFKGMNPEEIKKQLESQVDNELEKEKKSEEDKKGKEESK